MKIIDLNNTLSDLFHESIQLCELKDQTAKKWYDKNYLLKPINEDFVEGLIYGIRINNEIEYDFCVQSIDNLFKSFLTNFINKYKVKQIDIAASTNGIKYYTKESALKTVTNGFNGVRVHNGIMYSTNYGIGIWFIFMPVVWTDNAKNLIQSKLKELNINFQNEFSDAGWVYRYLIDGNYIDHNKIVESIHN
jgi:hypothetical protein